MPDRIHFPEFVDGLPDDVVPRSEKQALKQAWCKDRLYDAKLLADRVYFRMSEARPEDFSIRAHATAMILCRRVEDEIRACASEAYERLAGVMIACPGDARLLLNVNKAISFLERDDLPQARKKIHALLGGLSLDGSSCDPAAEAGLEQAAAALAPVVPDNPQAYAMQAARIAGGLE